MAPERPDLEQLAHLAVHGSDLDDLGGSLIKAVNYILHLEAQRDVVRESLLRMEWDQETDVHQCAWCMGHQSYGHHTGCPMAALLARLGDKS